jgi:SpoVK/Ycf46/Vps4 family AAA+-type ATPase
MAEGDLLDARPGMEHFSRALAAFLEFVLPPIEEVLGKAGGEGTASADQLALAEAYAIVSAFVPADGTVSEDEAAALVRAGGRAGAPAVADEADREELGRFLDRGRASTSGRSFGLACCAIRDAGDGGVRGRRYLTLASALADATCALDGESDGERREIRALEERLFRELEDDVRRIRAGGLRIELPNGGRPGTTDDRDASGQGVAAEPAQPESVEDALAALERLIGLRSVKEQVTSITNLLRVQQRRKALGLPVPVSSHHMAFVGPPGTGKTTVARLLGRIFRALGLLDHGEVKEVAREDLVGGYLGETAMKADRVVDEALGGILFVDEAYTLAPENPQDSFGREAIATLVKRMEDDRDRFVLIVAGYEDEMRGFLRSNPGLSSRFPETIRFPDYSPEELRRILALFVEDAGYRLAPEAERHAAEAIRDRWERRDKDFGNARMVRNLFEDMIAAHANRVADDQAADAEKLCRIEAVDVGTAVREGRAQLDVS